MRVTANRAGLALGISLLLGAVDVAGQTVVEGCRATALLEGAAGPGHDGGWVGVVSRAHGRARLILVGSAEPLLCVPGPDEGVLARKKTTLTNGENVYIRGFGSFVIRKPTPTPTPTPTPKPAPTR